MKGHVDRYMEEHNERMGAQLGSKKMEAWADRGMCKQMVCRRLDGAMIGGNGGWLNRETGGEKMER